ncbi:hypothetical protein B0H14DRAFT_3128029 [Mycena olivaceomarginata]|nr:hypothetical protein B0H14DRAFT_3128029 [Mycena olivaceomarginata]
MPSRPVCFLAPLLFSALILSFILSLIARHRLRKLGRARAVPLQKTQNDAWLKPWEENISANVRLRVELGHFRVLPYENQYLVRFEPAVRALNPLVAIKVVAPPRPRASGGQPANQDTESRILQALEQASAHQDLSKSLLRLTYFLQQCLQNRNSQSAIELLMTQPALLDNLCKAHMGNYGIILSLLGCLDHGLQAKRPVDRVIDADLVPSLREDILMHRLDQHGGGERRGLFGQAVKALEKYFFIIAFTSFVDGTEGFSQSFSDWLTTRTGTWNQIKFMRKSYGPRLNVFAPIHVLSSLSKTNWEDRGVIPGKKDDMAIAGRQILGDEHSKHNWSGIFLQGSTKPHSSGLTSGIKNRTTRATSTRSAN